MSPARLAVLALVLSACGPVPPKQPCTTSACDAVGTWDVTVDLDAGNACANHVVPPRSITFYRDGGALCAAAVTSMSSDGGCGLSVSKDFVDPSQIDPSSNYQTLDLVITGPTFTGSDTMSVSGYGICGATLPITGVRR